MPHSPRYSNPTAEAGRRTALRPGVSPARRLCPGWAWPTGRGPPCCRRVVCPAPPRRELPAVCAPPAQTAPSNVAYMPIAGLRLGIAPALGPNPMSRTLCPLPLTLYPLPSTPYPLPLTLIHLGVHAGHQPLALQAVHQVLRRQSRHLPSGRIAGAGYVRHYHAVVQR